MAFVEKGGMVFRRSIFFLISLFFLSTSFSQSFSPGDLLRQNKKQKKLLIDQIIAYRASSEALQKGNKILLIGTNIIGLVKGNELSLHSRQFELLNVLNSNVYESEMRKRLQWMFTRAEQRYRELKISIYKWDNLASSEQRTFKVVLDAIQNSVLCELDAFEILIRNSRYQMSDNDRLRNLTRILERMEKLLFDQEALNRKFYTLMQSKQRSGNDARLLRILNIW